MSLAKGLGHVTIMEGISGTRHYGRSDQNRLKAFVLKTKGIVMVGRKTNNRFKSIEESLLPYITEIGKQQDMLVDIGVELSNMRNNISKNSTDDVKHQLKLQRVEHMSSLISLTHILVGYDTERLSMLGMVKDEHKDQCFDVSREYMKNTHKVMSMNHTYWETLSVSVDNDDIKQLVRKTRNTMNIIYPLYKKCLEILKSKKTNG